MTAEQYRAHSWIVCLAFLASIAALAVTFTFFNIPWIPTQEQKQLYWLSHDAIYKINISVATCCLFPLIASTVNLVRQCVHCRQKERSGEQVWAPNRKRIAGFALCSVVAQCINILFWLLQNAYIIGKDCSWFDQFVNGCTLVQWTCLNFVFSLHIIWASSMTPWVDKEGKPQTNLPGRRSWRFMPDPIQMDKPLSWRQAHKLIFGIFFQSIIFFYAFWIGFKGGIGRGVLIPGNLALQAQGPPACFTAEYICLVDVPYLLVTWSFIVLVFCHAMLVFFHIERAQDKLQAAGSYLLWERHYKMVKTLEFSCGWITTTGLASVTGLFLTKHVTSCSTIIFSWAGILPLQVSTSIIACTNAWYYFPRPARQSDVMQQAWLRELVWREEETPQLREKLAEALPDFKEVLVKEPVFCFDATAKLLVWSDLVYTFEDNMHAKETLEQSESSGGFSFCCPCFERKEGASADPRQARAAGTPPAERPLGTMQEYAQELPTSNPLPGHMPPSHIPHQAPKSQTMDGEESGQPPSPKLATADRLFSLGRRKLSRQKSGSSDHPEGVVSLKLSEDGHLTQEGTDIEIEVDEGVASGAGLGLAMRLFGLDGFEILYEEKLQTKVLLGWSESCLVLSFRGTANAVNAWTDLKVLRQRHHSLPPGHFWLGQQPLVHGGFLQSWLSGGLNLAVLRRVRQIVQDSACGIKDFKVYATGHSLGGALATLAAVEIAQHSDLPAVKCITFGAPRTGNHAFARAYNELVPDTWHIINDRDAVPRIGKFFCLFKRPGQRVLVNRSGDCRVRPDPIQVALHQEGFSVKAHLLNSYRKALAAILKCQLVPIRSRQGGRQAFEAFAVDEDMHALGQYLGLDMRKLLQVAPSEIKLKSRASTTVSAVGPLRKLQLIKFTVRTTKFLFGDHLAEAVRGVIFWLLRGKQGKEEDSVNGRWQAPNRSFPEV